MENIVIVVVVAVIIGLAGYYVYRAKKNGKTCIGCPYSDCPSKKRSSCCGCGAKEEDENTVE